MAMLLIQLVFPAYIHCNEFLYLYFIFHFSCFRDGNVVDPASVSCLYPLQWVSRGPSLLMAPQHDMEAWWACTTRDSNVPNVFMNIVIINLYKLMLIRCNKVDISKIWIQMFLSYPSPIITLPCWYITSARCKSVEFMHPLQKSSNLSLIMSNWFVGFVKVFIQIC